MKRFTEKRVIKILIVCVIICSLFLVTTPVYALYQSTSFYNSIAWTWQYYATGSWNNNCLGYALGYTWWEWPWGGRNPSNSEVNSYMASKGYARQPSGSTGYSTRVISYGTSSAVDHFARNVGSGGTWTSGTSRAKWGHLEIMTSYSHDPYYTSSYGHIVSKYY